ncbi:MAG TPA: hypothetical protein VLE27_06800 [Thermoanaerobaculia bacterium]|nr:hypothetical protein [Thermoanaerobaculia bacterium]
MQPDRGIQAQEARQLFLQGRWEELEELYKNNLKEDPADAPSAFRLGNLLAMRERYPEALEYFETAWLHRWPGPIALNNKGVVLACLGEARPAFKTLFDATKLEQGCRPAAYNLGILCEKLGSEGSLPEVLLDLGLAKAGGKASDLSRTFFEQALDGKGPPGWAETDIQDRPLFLWTEDLDSSFGFEQKREIVNIEEAYGFYNEGVALIESGHYEEGISRLDAAADLNPDLEERIKEPKTTGVVGLVRSRFSVMRQKLDRKEFDGAAQTFDEILQMAPMVSDRAFADEILAAAIRNLAQQIRSHKPEDGWECLQKMITAARQRAEGHEGAFAVAGEDEDPDIEKTPEPASAKEEGASVKKPPSPPKESPAAEYIRGVCRQAWDQQINYLLGQGDYQGAINLLDFPDIEWFAWQDLPRWKLRALTAKAEILRARGRDAFERQSWKEAVSSWKEGRDAAVLAEDPRVVQSFDRLIGELLAKAPSRVRGELLGLLKDHNDRQELERCAQELEQRPGDKILLARRQALIAQLLSQAGDAISAQQWQAAKEMAEAILKALPEESRARDLLRRAQEKLLQQWTTDARDLLERERLEEAEELCEKIEEEDPDHAGAREVRLKIEILRRRGGNGPSLFDRAFFAYVEARDAGNPERALGPALEMKRLDPKNSHTREALEWLPEAYIHDLRVQLESDRGKAAGLREKLKPLLDLIPNYPAALKLDKELRKSEKGYGDKKRELSYRKLADAEDWISKENPEKALKALNAIRDPDLADEVQERRQDALALLQQQIDELLSNPSEENARKVETLRRIYQRWDPVSVAAKLEEDARRQEAKASEKNLNEEMRRLRGILSKKPKTPFKALRELDDAIRALDLEGSPIRARKSKEIRELRQRLFRNMTPLQRFFAKIYNLYYAPSLPEPAADEKEGKPS